MYMDEQWMNNGKVCISMQVSVCVRCFLHLQATAAGQRGKIEFDCRGTQHGESLGFPLGCCMGCPVVPW